jgi:hypothetical protein
MTWVSGHLIATGVFVLAAVAACAAVVLLAVLAVRRSGHKGMKIALWGGGLVLGCVLLTSLLLDRMPTRDIGAERRAIEARASELTAHAIAPGSALTCLDAVGSDAVESACEKVLFATPETVAAALAYVEARYSLLVASAALADRDPSYQPTVERLRRGIEADRFGLVAQVFSTRGCNASECADFAVLHDSGRIVANMKGHIFATHVALHALAWNPSGTAPVLAGSSPNTSPAIAKTEPGTPPVTTDIVATAPATTSTSGTPSRARYDYPSAGSIPAISIMDPETDPPAGDKAVQKRPQSSRSAARNQGASAPPHTTPAPSTPSQSPTIVSPQPQPQTSGSP